MKQVHNCIAIQPITVSVHAKHITWLSQRCCQAM